KKPPSVKVERYDTKAEGPEPEKQLSLRRLVEIRFQQIDALERLTGQQKDDKGQTTAESTENAGLIAGLGGLKLDDNEGWRQFLLAKCKAQRAAGTPDDAALAATIDVLPSYLRAFTFHTPLNIDEFGDNYLTRTFPRALTGQLLHDCGVYALRVTYALSLVRDEL